MKLAAYGIVLSTSALVAGEVIPDTPIWLQGGGLVALATIALVLLNKTIPEMQKSHKEERQAFLDYLQSQRTGEDK